MRTAQSNKLDFKGQNIYIGIDVHKTSWAVSVLSENATLKKFSQDPKPEALHKYLMTNYPGASYHSVYEAGFSGFWTHHRLTELGISNIVVNPADVPTMNKEKLHKTDAVDSGKLARELRAGTLKGIYVPDTQSLEIRSLIRLRNSIVKDTTRQKNRIKGLLFFHGVQMPAEFANSKSHWSKRFVQWLREVELTTDYGRKALDMHIEQLLRLREMLLQETRIIRQLSRKEPFAESLRFIMSVPGIGITTGISFVTEIDDIKRFKNSYQLASFVGLIPMCHSSGEKTGVGDITVRKQAILRYSIIEAAWKAIKHDPAMTMAFEGYTKRMPPSKAIVKIARKLVNRIYFVLKRRQEYVPCIVG